MCVFSNCESTNEEIRKRKFVSGRLKFKKVQLTGGMRSGQLTLENVDSHSRETGFGVECLDHICVAEEKSSR